MWILFSMWHTFCHSLGRRGFREISLTTSHLIPIISFMSTDSLTTICSSYYNTSSGVCCQLNSKLCLLQQPDVGTHLRICMLSLFPCFLYFLICRCTFILVDILCFSIIYFSFHFITFFIKCTFEKGSTFLFLTSTVASKGDVFFLLFFTFLQQSTKKH